MNPHDTVTKQEFLDSLFKLWNPEPQIEIIPLSEARGRILAEDQFAKYDLPVFRASQMDGIAVRSADFADGTPDTAGWVYGKDYVRADTGDDFDDAFDAVIMIEQVELHEDRGPDIHLDPGQKIEPGTCVAPKGSRTAKGSLAAYGGFTIDGISAASMINGGITEVPVIKRPTVAYIPTGSELVPPGSVPQRGQNINSNAALVEDLLERFGAKPVLFDIVRDDREMLSAALDKAIAEADIVLMSGGSSKGEEDYTTRLFEEHGHLLTHWVKAVPGRPMSVALDAATGTPLINLSGPPAACLNGMIWCVNTIIARFMGRDPYIFPYEWAVLDEDLHGPGIMEMLQTLYLYRAGDGMLHARFTNRSLACNGFYITGMGEEFVPAGGRILASMFCPAADY